MSTSRALHIAFAIAFASFVLPRLAAASTLLFSFTGPDGSASWIQSSTPTPIAYGLDVYTDVSVTATGPDSFGNAFSDVEFFPVYTTGGFTIGNDDIAEAGAQAYGGDESAPMFAPGVYATDTYIFGSGASGTPGGVLTITAVPEPSVWLVLGIGFGALGLSRRGVRLAP
jgi:hypothetical protein